MSWSILYIVLCLLLLSISSGIVGTSLFLQKKSLYSDVIAHAILPAIVSSVLLFKVKDLSLFVVFGVAFSLLVQLGLSWLKTHSKLKEDALMAVFLSFSFALGMLMLGVLESNPYIEKAGLKSYLFGNVAALDQLDFIYLTVWTLVVMLMHSVFYHHIFYYNFHSGQKVFQKTARWIPILTKLMISITIVLGIKSVGFILMGAFLISAIIFGRIWSFSVKNIILLAIGVNISATFTGFLISIQYRNMPTGPIMVLVLSLFITLSLFFAPNTLLGRYIRNYRRNKLDIQTQNVLKALYYSYQTNEVLDWDEMARQTDLNHLKKHYLKWLFKRKKWIFKVNDTFHLSEKGNEEGRKMVRKHRLWETYLASKLRMEDDHIHFNAESIEHILDDETVKMLEIELDHPKSDPHNKKIP